MTGVIAAGSPFTAQVGADMFQIGGNAVDAAVAATFASFVSETLVVNIGGGGFAVVAERGNDAGTSHTTAYDFICSTPAPRDPKQMDFRKILVDFGDDQQPFYIGRASTAVPGVMAGLCHMARTRGSLPLETLLKPAAKLAAEGYALSDVGSELLRLLAPIYTDTPALRKIFAPNGNLLQAGDRVFLPQLAHTLESLATDGKKAAAGFYRGHLANAIIEDHAQHGGLLTAEDLAGYTVLEDEPIRIGYRGYEVLLPPPASHGGVLIAFALKLLHSLALQPSGAYGVDHLRKLAHVMRVNSLARADWERDPHPDRECVDHFLSETHLGGWFSKLESALKSGISREATGPAIGPGHTSHISAIDDQGTAVSITTSAGESAGYLVGDTGVCLNNMLGELDLNPHGFHQDPAGTRMRSMMSPAVVLKNGEPVMAVGSAGSNRLRSAILQSIVNVIDFGMSPQEAVAAPRLHYEAGVLHVEHGIEPSVIAALENDGFNVKVWRSRNIFFGGAQAVCHVGGSFSGGADPRRGGGVAR